MATRFHLSLAGAVVQASQNPADLSSTLSSTFPAVSSRPCPTTADLKMAEGNWLGARWVANASGVLESGLVVYLRQSENLFFFFFFLN